MTSVAIIDRLCPVVACSKLAACFHPRSAVETETMVTFISAFVTFISALVFLDAMRQQSHNGRLGEKAFLSETANTTFCSKVAIYRTPNFRFPQS